MSQDPIFDIDSLIQARADLLREARALPPGGERNQKRQIAGSLKRLLQAQIKARDYSLRAASLH